MDFNFSEFRFNWVDFLVVLVLAWGVTRGRRRGMSGELLDLTKWILVLIAGAYLYEPLGQLFAQYTYVSRLYSYLIVYSLIIILFVMVFSQLRPKLGDKLVTSDFFGNAEYYLGMLGGAARYVCIILVLLALLNARHFSGEEIRAENAYQENYFGSIRFPTLITLQTAILENSFTGSTVRTYLSPLLIRATDPEEREIRSHSIARAREQLIDQVMQK